MRKNRFSEEQFVAILKNHTAGAKTAEQNPPARGSPTKLSTSGAPDLAASRMRYLPQQEAT
jgi:hypothetical protein